MICSSAFLVNSYFLRAYPSLIGKYNIIKGYLSLTTAESLNILKNQFLRSDVNVFLFIIAVCVILLTLRMHKIGKSIRYFSVISFVLVDLLSYNHSAYKFMTMPRINEPVYASEKPFLYRDYRIPVVQPLYPFFGYLPSMIKEFTAYSTSISWVTTHFYETKVFFELLDNRRIPNEVKNVLMAVPAYRIRLVPAAVVLPRDKIISALESINADSAWKAIFVEEDLPAAYSGLKIPLNGMGSETPLLGDVKVLNFNPNEISLEVSADKDSFLYYSDVYDKDWRVFIDNREGKVYKANLAFKSAIIGKGSHRVSFVYDPRLYKFSLFCYLSGILISIAIFFGVRTKD
jgi:hypothetical protein